jgi:sterol 14-demethylase
MIRVSVDRKLCSGHAVCQARCPEVFGSDDHGYCVVLKSEVPDSLLAGVRLGEASCPEGAIKVIES